MKKLLSFTLAALVSGATVFTSFPVFSYAETVEESLNQVKIAADITDPEIISNIQQKTLESAEQLANLGYIPKPADGNYGLDQPISRRELARIHYNIFGKGWYGLKEAKKDYKGRYFNDDFLPNKFLDVQPSDPDFVPLVFATCEYAMAVRAVSMVRPDNRTREGAKFTVFPDRQAILADVVYPWYDIAEFVNSVQYPEHIYISTSPRVDPSKRFTDPFFPEKGELAPGKEIYSIDYALWICKHLHVMYAQAGLWQVQPDFGYDYWCEKNLTPVSRGEAYLAIATCYNGMEKFLPEGVRYSIDRDYKVCFETSQR